MIMLSVCLRAALEPPKFMDLGMKIIPSEGKYLKFPSIDTENMRTQEFVKLKLH